jgi:hypothetical protein
VLVGGQLHVAAVYLWERDSVPILQEAGWAPDCSGRVRTISPQSSFEPRTVQPVASRYTDCAIPAQRLWLILNPITGKLCEFFVLDSHISAE